MFYVYIGASKFKYFYLDILQKHFIVISARTYSTCSRLPEDEPSGSKHVEGFVKIKKNIVLTKVHFVGLYYAIMLQCTMHKT